MIRDKAGNPREVNYAIKRLIYRPEDSAGRLALSPLRKAICGQSHSRGECALKEYAAVLAAWRGRVKQLHSHDWPADLESYARMLNCPPANVQTNWPHPGYCHKAFLCPFCWVRRHIPAIHSRLVTYYGLQEDAEAGNVRITVSRRREPLVEIIRRVPLPKECGARGALQWVEDHRWEVHAGLFEGLVSGCWQLFALAPPLEEGQAYQLQQRVLMPLREHVPEIPVLDATFQVHVHTRVTRRVLIGAVGRACSYPTALVLGCEQRMLDLCNRLQGGQRRAKGFRLSSTYGAIRGHITGNVSIGGGYAADS